MECLSLVFCVCVCVYFRLLLPSNSFYWWNPDKLDWLVCSTIYDSPNCANRNVHCTRFIVNIRLFCFTFFRAVVIAVFAFCSFSPPVCHWRLAKNKCEHDINNMSNSFLASSHLPTNCDFSFAVGRYFPSFFSLSIDIITIFWLTSNVMR